MRTDDDGDRYLNLRELSDYTGLSTQRLRNLTRRPDYPLPHYRVGVRVLVKRSEFDAWVQAGHGELRPERAAGGDRVAVIAAAAVRAIRGGR
jgi:excisionase family DNA binding protein